MCSWLRLSRSSPVTRRSVVEARLRYEARQARTSASSGRSWPVNRRAIRSKKAGLGQASGRRQQAEHGPLHAVGEGQGGGGDVGLLGEPPAPRLDLDEPLLVRPAELVADDREDRLDLVVPGQSGGLAALVAPRAGGQATRGDHRLGSIRAIRAVGSLPGEPGRDRVVRGSRRPGCRARHAADGPTGRRRGRSGRADRRAPRPGREWSPRRQAGGSYGRPGHRAGRRSAARRAAGACPPGPCRRGPRRGAAPGGPARRGPGGSRPRYPRRSGPASAPENGRRSKRSGAAKRPRPGTTSGSPVPPGVGARPMFARVRGGGASVPPGGMNSTMPPTSSPGSPSRAPTSRNPARTPPRAAATSASGPPASRNRTTRASRASHGSMAASDRPSAAACQPHGARPPAPNSDSSGSRAAASRPRSQPVAR